MFYWGNMSINQQLEICTCIFIWDHGNIDHVHDGELQSSHNKSLVQIFGFTVFTILQKKCHAFSCDFLKRWSRRNICVTFCYFFLIYCANFFSFSSYSSIILLLFYTWYPGNPDEMLDFHKRKGHLYLLLYKWTKQRRIRVFKSRKLIFFSPRPVYRDEIQMKMGTWGAPSLNL